MKAATHCSSSRLIGRHSRIRRHTSSRRWCTSRCCTWIQLICRAGGKLHRYTYTERHQKNSLRFSLNKMNSFLTQHQADPWVFFIKSWPLAKVRSVPSKPICVILCCMNRSRALLSACLTHARHLWAVQSTREGLGGVGEGNFTAWIFACSVGTCVQHYPTVTCSKTCQAVAWKSKLKHTEGLT